jgi:hypothetical protein
MKWASVIEPSGIQRCGEYYYMFELHFITDVSEGIIASIFRMKELSPYSGM